MVNRRFDFSSIDIQEELASLEATEFVSWGEWHGKYLHRKANPVTTIRTPFNRLGGDYEFTVGGYHLLGGYSGHGKSVLALQCALYAAKEHKVAIASLEMEPEAVARLSYQLIAGTSIVDEKYEGKISRWLEDRVMAYDRLDTIAPDDAIAMVIAAAKAGCKLILLDCLFMIESVCQDTEAEQKFTQRLANVGKKFRVAIVLVHHMKKPDNVGEKKIPSKAGFIGSSHMVNASLSCAIVWRDFELIEMRDQGMPTEDHLPDVMLKVDKNRHFKFHGLVPLYEHSSRSLCESSKRQVKRIVDL